MALVKSFTLCKAPVEIPLSLCSYCKVFLQPLKLYGDEETWVRTGVVRSTAVSQRSTVHSRCPGAIQPVTVRWNISGSQVKWWGCTDASNRCSIGTVISCNSLFSQTSCFFLKYFVQQVLAMRHDQYLCASFPSLLPSQHCIREVSINSQTAFCICFWFCSFYFGNSQVILKSDCAELLEVAWSLLQIATEESCGFASWTSNVLIRSCRNQIF